MKTYNAPERVSTRKVIQLDAEDPNSTVVVATGFDAAGLPVYLASPSVPRRYLTQHVYVESRGRQLTPDLLRKHARRFERQERCLAGQRRADAGQ